jgi:hypothetical protein
MGERAVVCAGRSAHSLLSVLLLLLLQQLQDAYGGADGGVRSAGVLRPYQYMISGSCRMSVRVSQTLQYGAGVEQGCVEDSLHTSS